MTDKEFLRYRIHSVSSQASPNGCLKLLDPHQQQGWASAPNCSYPQYIVLQFFLPVQTMSLSLLFHQYKIPSSVQVFVKQRKKQPYQRLGYIRPSNNQQTAWEQRQLKSVYFQYPCSFIKLVLQQPYPNKYNVLKQVALQEITIKGSLLEPDLGWLSLNTITAQDESQSQQQIPSRFEQPRQIIQPRMPQSRSKVDLKQPILPQIQEVFQILVKKKQDAVEEQNYELANLIKTQINNIKNMQSRLFQLQFSKQKAIQVQDYTQAATLRNQISKLKQSVQYQLTRLTSSATPPSRSFSLNSPQPNRNYQKDSSIYISANNNTFISQQHQSQMVSALAQRVNHSHFKDQRKLDIDSESQLIKQIQADTKLIQELDSRTQIQIKKYQHIVPLQDWIIILGKNWKQKQSVLLTLQNIEFQNLDQVIVTLQICSFSIRDKHPSILYYSLALILNVLNSQVCQQMTTIPQSLSSILQFMPPLLIDNNQKTRQLALECLISLPDLPCIHLSHIINLFVNRKIKSKQAPKLIQAKFQVIKALSTKYKLSHQQLIQILQWGVGFLQDSNQEIRTASSEFILYSLAPILGIQIIKDKVKNIRPNVLNTFLTSLNSLPNKSQCNTARNKPSKSGNNTSRLRSQQSELYKQKFQPSMKSFHLQKDIKTDRSQIQQQSEEQIKLFEYIQQSQHPHQQDEQNQDEYEQQDLCDYCKCILEGPDYDLSYQKHIEQCRMMIKCQECSYLVCIKNLCDHLLHDCENSKYHQCDNCGLAFPFNQLHSHRAEGSCKIRKKGFDKCQVCTRDVPDNYDAWIAHAQYCR